MRGRKLVDAILEAHEGVLDIRNHRSLRSTVHRLVREGALTRVFPAIYVLTATARHPNMLLAAALAWLPDAVVTGDTAAAIHNDEPVAGELQLTNPRRVRARRGVRIRTGHVPTDQRSDRHNRLAGHAWAAVEAAQRDKGRLMDNLLRLKVITASDIAETWSWFTRRRGNSIRKPVVAAGLRTPFAYSERLLHSLLDQAGIGDWLANPDLFLEGRLVVPDVLFPRLRIVIEVDGYEFHSSRESFEDDRERRNLLEAQGYAILQFTWKMLTEQSAAVISRIKQLLKRRAHGR